MLAVKRVPRSLTSLSVLALAGAALAAAGGGSWVQVAKLTASDRQPEEDYGGAVAISGDTALVGATKADVGYLINAGAVYVYERDLGGAGAWGERTKIVASDGQATDRFGRSVAIDGDTAVIGAFRHDHSGLDRAGAAYVHERDQGGPDAWGEVTKLTAGDPSNAALFGFSVGVSGDTAVVGSMRKGESGAAYVFERNLGGANAWGEAAKLVPSDGGLDDRFGNSVAIDGDTIVVGALKDSHAGGFNAGSVYVFVREGTNWTEQAKLIGSQVTGQDRFGVSVDVSGNTIIGGSILDDVLSMDTGAAYVFVRTGTLWTEQQLLVPSNGAQGDRFGVSVAVDGDRAVVGSYLDDELGFTNLGSAYAFSRAGTTWTEEQKLAPSDPVFAFFFGQAAALDGSTIVVGSSAVDVTFNFLVGSAYVYDESAGIAASYCAAGTSASGCQVALSAVGTPSASAASGFDLIAPFAEGGQQGAFLIGTRGRAALPWGSGTSWLCVADPALRTAVLEGGGTPGACDGRFTQDLNELWCPTCPDAAYNPGAGAVVQAQLWYRDPVDPLGALSDAVELVLAP